MVDPQLTIEICRALASKVGYGRGGADTVRAVTAGARGICEPFAFCDICSVSVHSAKVVAIARIDGSGLRRRARRIMQPE